MYFLGEDAEQHFLHRRTAFGAKSANKGVSAYMTRLFDTFVVDNLKRSNHISRGNVLYSNYCDNIVTCGRRPHNQWFIFYGSRATLNNQCEDRDRWWSTKGDEMHHQRISLTGKSIQKRLAVYVACNLDT